MARAVPGHPSGIRKIVLALVSQGGLPGSSSCTGYGSDICREHVYVSRLGQPGDTIHMASLPAWVCMCPRKWT